MLDIFFFGGLTFPRTFSSGRFFIHDHSCFFSRKSTSYLVPLGFGYGWSHESHLLEENTLIDIPFSSSHGVKDFGELDYECAPSPRKFTGLIARFVFSDHVDGRSLARLMALSTCALTRLRASPLGNS